MDQGIDLLRNLTADLPDAQGVFVQSIRFRQPPIDRGDLKTKGGE